VGNETHIGLIDAHAEGDGSDDDDAFFVDEARLVACAHFGGKPGVIGQRVQALGLEPFGDFLHALARQAINDAGVAGVFRANEPQQLFARAAAALGDAVTDIGAVETADERARLFQPEARADLAARGLVGGGRERDARDAREALVQHRKLHVLRAEIVAPLRDAMRLVDGEQRDPGARQQIERALEQQAFGRDVKQIESAIQ